MLTFNTDNTKLTPLEQFIKDEQGYMLANLEAIVKDLHPRHESKS